jgi:hypothetical protein
MVVAGIHLGRLLRLLLVALEAGHLAVTYSQRLYLARRELLVKALLAAVPLRRVRAELLVEAAVQVRLVVLQQYQIPLVMAAQALHQALRVRLLLMLAAAVVDNTPLAHQVLAELVAVVPVIRTVVRLRMGLPIPGAAVVVVAQVERRVVMAALAALVS